LKELNTEEKLDVAVSKSMSYMIMEFHTQNHWEKIPKSLPNTRLNSYSAYQFMKGRHPLEMIDIMNRVPATDKYFVYRTK
jgi:hypothetical protein